MGLQAYGHAKLDAEPCTTETIFDLASTSKTMTAAAVACLVDDEKFPEVQWTTPVSKLLPDDFVLQDSCLTAEVTIEDILCHRTGLPSHDVSYLGRHAKHPDDAKSITRNLRNLSIARPLRTHWMYSNIMYTVATHLVSTVTGENYTDYLHKRLWDPLGMTNTFHDAPDIEAHSATARQATGYTFDRDKNEYISIISGPEPEGQGAGCIWSSAGDYAKWIRALLTQNPPLSRDAYNELIRPRMVVPDPDPIPFYSDLLYALGLQKESYRGRSIISHDGSVDGFRAKVAFLPDQNWGIVMFGNAENAFFLQQVLFHVLMDDLLDIPEAEREDWNKFFRGWENEGIEEEKKNAEDDKFKKPADAQPLGVNLEKLVGTYHDKGYKDLVLEMKDGFIVADCTDRCYPFILTFEHLSGVKFAVKMVYTRVGQKRTMMGEVKLRDDESVGAVGVDFEEDLKDQLIWFDRVV